MPNNNPTEYRVCDFKLRCVRSDVERAVCAERSCGGAA
jgi:hypothetical protein